MPVVITEMFIITELLTYFPLGSEECHIKKISLKFHSIIQFEVGVIIYSILISLQITFRQNGLTFGSFEILQTNQPDYRLLFQ